MAAGVETGAGVATGVSVGAGVTVKVGAGVVGAGVVGTGVVGAGVSVTVGAGVSVGTGVGEPNNETSRDGVTGVAGTDRPAAQLLFRTPIAMKKSHPPLPPVPSPSSSDLCDFIAPTIHNILSEARGSLCSCVSLL